MRLSRRLTGVLLVLVLAGALTPTALAGTPNWTPPPVATVVIPEPAVASMIDIEALR